jgi:hypothetical protein
MAVELNIQQLDDISAQCAASDLATVLRVEFAFDATGQAQQAVILECPSAIRRFGRIESTYQAKWTRSARQAESIGKAMLENMARPSWSISATIPPAAARKLLPGDDVVLTHPWLPSGTAMVTDLEEQPLAMTATMTCRIAAGAMPTITLTKQAGAFAPLGAGGVSVDYAAGVATLTILDDSSRPLAGARVTLDGSTTRITDAKGQVQFKTSRGAHTIRITAPGYADMESEIVI